MAIEDILNRIAAGEWSGPTAKRKRAVQQGSDAPQAPAPCETGLPLPEDTNNDVDAEDLKPVKELALRVLSDPAVQTCRKTFGGELELTPFTDCLVISDPHWVDVCPKGHAAGDYLWVKKCVGVICLKCQMVYDPGECGLARGIKREPNQASQGRIRGS